MTVGGRDPGRRWRWLPVAVVAILAAGSLGLTCGPAPPSSDTCTLAVPADAGEPFDGTLTSLEIGSLVGGTFTPFVDDDVATLQLGGQGSLMIVAHLRLRGSGIPSCLPQKTVMEQLDGSLIVSEEAAMVTAPAGAGVWHSGAMLLVYFGSSGVPVRLRAEALGMQRSVVVWVDQRGTVDAGVDAAVDAGVDPDASFAP